jgi:hypothetical protein
VLNFGESLAELIKFSVCFGRVLTLTNETRDQLLLRRETLFEACVVNLLRPDSNGTLSRARPSLAGGLTI